jgi:hypothetical protein
MYVQEDGKIQTITPNTPEGIWCIGAKVKILGTVFQIYTIYRSPAQPKNMFLDFFETWVEETSFPNNKTTITGDINIDFMIPSAATTRLSHILASKNLKIHNSTATRVTERTLTMIDLVITNWKQL